MTLQQVYDKYVKGNHNLKEVELIFYDEALEIASIKSKSEEFFGIKTSERGQEVIIEDKSSYYDLDNASFEIVHDPYEKDYGYDEDSGPIIATIQYDILKITLPQRELLLSDYQKALEIAKTRNKELSEQLREKDRKAFEVESEARATRYFYEHPEQRQFHDLKVGEDMTKYIYEVHLCGKSDDEIQESIVDDLIYCLLHYEPDEIDELRRMMIDVNRKDELMDYIANLLDEDSPGETTIRNIYGLEEDEYVPTSTEIAKDYLDEVRDLFVVKATIKDTDMKCLKFRSYSQALEKMKYYREKEWWPQIAIHEVKMAGDGTSERTLINLDSFMFDYMYAINKKEE